MANYELNTRSTCPLISERERHIVIGGRCVGNECVFALDGVCSIAYKAALEVELLKRQLASGSGSIFKHTCENGITHTCYLLRRVNL